MPESGKLILVKWRRSKSWLAATLFVFWLSAAPAADAGIAEAWQGAYWGESSAALLAHLGGGATVLSPPIDFGDSYADVVLRNVPVGGFPLIAYFQMDKATHGLKRIQLERPRHSVNPAAFRGVLAALEGAYGAPDAMCGTAPGPASGYQVGAERIWRQRQRYHGERQRAGTSREWTRLHASTSRNVRGSGAAGRTARRYVDHSGARVFGLGRRLGFELWFELE